VKGLRGTHGFPAFAQHWDDDYSQACGRGTPWMSPWVCRIMGVQSNKTTAFITTQKY